MATKQTYHQYDPADMPVIRHIRTELIQSFKIRDKVERTDVISKAIIKDVDFKKLGLDPKWPGALMESLQEEIQEWRSDLKKKLDLLLQEEAILIETSMMDFRWKCHT